MQKQKETKKCSKCNKKLGLVTYSCKCNKLFCSMHLHFTEHECTFNYKSDSEKYLEKQMPKELKEKFERI